MTPTLYDDQRRVVSTGRELGRGGEGSILEIRDKPSLVAKIYHKPLDADRAAKLTAMANIATPDLLKIAAWPTGTLRAHPGGDLIGVIMPRVDAHREIHDVYGP